MRAAIGFILVTITLDMLSMSLVIPVLPALIQRFEGGNAIMAAHAIGIFATAWALMQFIFSPVQGALSDHFGRRPVILLSNLGLGLDCMLMAAAPSLAWLFLGRVIAGITAASFSCSTAYITDITPPEKRAARFGLIAISFGVAFVAGPVAGALLGAVNPRLPFWVSAGLSLVNFLFGLLVLPESLPPDRRSPFSWRTANPMGSLKLIRSRPGLSGLAVVNFLGLVSNNIMPTLVVLYAMNRYGFTIRHLAWLLGALGVCSAIVGGGLTGRVVRAIGERAALLAGFTCGAVAFVLMGLAPTGTFFLMAIPLWALKGIADPALTALMSRHVLGSQQGQLQGAVSALLGIAGLIGPTLYTESYAYFASPREGWNLPGVPFLISGLLLSGAVMVVAWRGREPQKEESTSF